MMTETKKTQIKSKERFVPTAKACGSVANVEMADGPCQVGHPAGAQNGFCVALGKKAMGDRGERIGFASCDAGHTNVLYTDVLDGLSYGLANRTLLLQYF